VHTDHLGSGRKVTDVSGNVVYRGEFDAHGQTLLEIGSVWTITNKFTGYERNWATHVDYAKARGYNRYRSRFLSPDPLGIGAADPSNPQSLNLYAYVNNDPVNFVDPSGLDDENGPLIGSSTTSAPYPDIFWPRGGGGPIVQFEVPAGGGGGGGGGEVGEKGGEQATNRTDNPCAGASSDNLDYSVRRSYGAGHGTFIETAEQHIMRRHGSGPLFSVASEGPSTSYYITSPPVTGSAMFEHIKALNAETFTHPTEVRTLGGNHGAVRGYVFIKKFPPIKTLPIFSSPTRRFIGYDRETQENTEMNNLFISADCKTVNTSFPGTP
jgi:RHS repeat-associated protein